MSTIVRIVPYQTPDKPLTTWESPILDIAVGDILQVKSIYYRVIGFGSKEEEGETITIAWVEEYES